MKTSKNETEYIPFANEWKKEMMKWTKPMLIDFLRKNLIEREEAERLLICVLDDDRFEFGKLNPHNGVKKSIQLFLENSNTEYPV